MSAAEKPATRGERDAATIFALACALVLAGCRTPAVRDSTDRDRALANRFNSAFALIVQHDYARALEILAPLENELRPDDELTPHVIYWSGHCYQEIGNAPEAARYYRRVIADYPRSKYARWAPRKLAELDSAGRGQ